MTGESKVRALAKTHEGCAVWVVELADLIGEDARAVDDVCAAQIIVFIIDGVVDMDACDPMVVFDEVLGLACS